MAKVQTWGRWKNLGQLGEGGMGHVFKVEHDETGEIGALKRLKNANRINRLRMEVKSIKSLEHPGIVKLLDENLTEDPCYAVFEYEEGGSLGELSIDELYAIPLTDRLELCVQICSALQAAHNALLVHRDIKPENILISPDRQKARLCDFGLVFVEDDERQTATIEQVGSRYYIPPELEDGRADRISSRSDIYSLGKVLYYLVSGEVYARERHREEKYDLALRFSDPHLETISRVLDKSVTDDIDSRFSSVEEMKASLKEAIVSISSRAPVRGVAETYQCVFCGVGTYEVVCDSSNSHNSGYKEGNIGNEQMVYVECSTCGNCQRFKLKYADGEWFPEAHAAWQSRR